MKRNNFYSTAFMAGGLGNQLFEISHAFAQGWKGNANPVLCLDYLCKSQHHKKADEHLENIFKRLPVVQSINDFTIENENESWLETLEPEWNSSIVFSGHFQSSKHFHGYDKQIQELFLPDENDIKEILKKYPKILNPGTASIHVRRGDYLLSNGVLPVLGLDYYEKAIEELGKYENLYVFSDDMDWCYENFKWPNITWVIENKSYFDLWAMSLCNHNIIPNSSFAWWASFLNLHDDKKVIAPSEWFGKYWEHKCMIHEETWKLINVESHGSYFKVVNNFSN